MVVTIAAVTIISEIAISAACATLVVLWREKGRNVFSLSPVYQREA